MHGNLVDLEEVQPVNRSVAVIQRVAERLVARLEFPPDGDLTALVKRLGGRIVEQDLMELASTDDGSLVVVGPSDFTIFLSGLYTSMMDIRFRLAHELGHYFVHYGHHQRPMRAPRHRSLTSMRADVEADAFAAAFLAPAAQFMSALKDEDDDLCLAVVFGIPLEVVEARRVQLLALVA